MEGQSSSQKSLWISISAISIVIFAFLFWWIYAKESASSSDLIWVAYLPYVNCALNTLTAILLCFGVSQIRKGNKETHQKIMISAGVVSALFLVSYLTYHHFQGDTKFMGQGLVRPIYFFILISHVILSMVQVPLILGTFFLAFTKKWATHKKVARITFPIWLYVSVTGVLVFIFLKTFNP
jgi:putative membrane protein